MRQGRSLWSGLNGGSLYMMPESDESLIYCSDAILEPSLFIACPLFEQGRNGALFGCHRSPRLS